MFSKLFKGLRFVGGRAYGDIEAAKTPKEADELNKKFRLADSKHRSELDFVVGIEIHPSNNPKLNCECCKQLAGKYPKSFKWHGWFEGCACYTTSILAPREEFIKQQKIYLKTGKAPKLKSKNEVKDYPAQFKIMGGFKAKDKLTQQQAEQAYKRIYDICNKKRRK